MSSKILVTGATGTIGSFVVDFLLKRRADFVAMVRSPEKAKPLTEKGIETRIGDFSDEASLPATLKGIDRLFLLSVTSPDSPKLQGNMIRAAKAAGVKYIVKISVRGAAENANINIGRWHGEIEEQIKESGLVYTFIRPHSFMQNLLFDAQGIQEQKAIYSPQGDGKIPFIDARDIAAVAARALTEDKHNNKTYVVTGPEAISYSDIASELSKALGKEIVYKRQTPADAREGMLAAGMPVWLVDDMIFLNESYSTNKASEVSPDVEKVLDRKAHSLADFISDYIEFFK